MRKKEYTAIIKVAIGKIERDKPHSNVVTFLSPIDFSFSSEFSKKFELYKAQDITSGEMIEALENLKQEL
jgi:hypothetical protein